MNHTRVVNTKTHKYDIYIGRPSDWGNPFSHLESEIAKFKVNSRLEAVQSFAYWLHEPEQSELILRLHELIGKTLGCFCEPNLCHGTVLAELADRLDEKFEYTQKEFGKENIFENTEINNNINMDILQEVYNYLFDLSKHIEIEGSEIFIKTVKNVVNHLNRIRTKVILILRETVSTENIIKSRK